FGNPYIMGARVTAEIVKQARADKVIVFKYKSKKNYRNKRGHRQYFTEVVIKNIEA
ncbi:MAG: 50S ribosomal protein L21, partial [Synergistaceae bacterium]|nr:50S ribosomal protein L21 [Synergistaceae bacterium]